MLYTIIKFISLFVFIATLFVVGGISDIFFTLNIMY